jgi:hypothetical protein
MNFHELLNRMRQLDAPAEAVTDKDMGECGPSVTAPMPPMKQDGPPPSLSVNINAHGMDDIADIMKLIAKVNPDMDKPSMPPLPAMNIEPSVTAIKPALPPLKMLPDMDADNDDMPGGEMDSDYNKDGKLDPHEKDHADEKPLLKSLDQDKDGDHDMDDHDTEPKDDSEDKDKEDDEKKEWANDPDPELKDVDYMVNKLAGGPNRPQKMTPHGYRNGDNPLAMEGDELRAYIKTELQRRLNEVKNK